MNNDKTRLTPEQSDRHAASCSVYPVLTDVRIGDTVLATVSGSSGKWGASTPHGRVFDGRSLPTELKLRLLTSSIRILYEELGQSYDDLANLDVAPDEVVQNHLYTYKYHTHSGLARVNSDPAKQHQFRETLRLVLQLRKELSEVQRELAR